MSSTPSPVRRSRSALVVSFLFRGGGETWKKQDHRDRCTRYPIDGSSGGERDEDGWTRGSGKGRMEISSSGRENEKFPRRGGRRKYLDVDKGMHR